MGGRKHKFWHSGKAVRRGHSCCQRLLKAKPVCDAIWIIAGFATATA